MILLCLTSNFCILDQSMLKQVMYIITLTILCLFCIHLQIIQFRQHFKHQAMGNQQPKKVSRPNKTQIDVGCLKAKIHLQMMRDRKNQEVIKGQKQLVAKIKSNSRNKTQQVLVAERVVNGLKYAGACNMLMAYANSLKGQSQFLCDNVGNREKLEPWLPMVYSLLYAAEHLGLSSLNQFKNAMRALNDPLAVDSYVNADVKQLLTPSPSPQELNIYILQMCQRNNIPLQQVNKIGHRFTKDIQRPPSIQNSEFNHMEQMLAQKFKQGFGGNQGQGFGNQGKAYGNQGGNGGFGNYTGTYGNPQNMGSYGQGGQNQNTAGFTNPVNKQKTPIVTPTINPNPNPQYLNDNMHNNNSNPYKGLSNVRDQGPKFYQPSKINNNNINTEKPRQFSDFDDIINPKNNNEDMGPMYPSVDMSNMKYQPYKPNQYKGYQHQKKEDLFDQPQKPHNQPSPTISQLLRSLGK